MCIPNVCDLGGGAGVGAALRLRGRMRQSGFSRVSELLVIAFILSNIYRLQIHRTKYTAAFAPLPPSFSHSTSNFIGQMVEMFVFHSFMC